MSPKLNYASKPEPRLFPPLIIIIGNFGGGSQNKSGKVAVKLELYENRMIQG